MSKTTKLFNERSTVDYFSEHFNKCSSQILAKDIIHLSEVEIKKYSKTLAGKHKIEEIPLSILNKYKRIDPPIPKWVPNKEFDSGGSNFLFIKYQVAHSVQNLDLFELYPKNFAGNIIDKRHTEITKNYIEFHINSDHCNHVIPAHKKLVIEQKRDKVIEDIERKVVGINSEMEEFNNGLCERLYILIIEKQNDFIDKNNNMNGL